LDLDDIRAIIDLMKKNDLAVFKLEREGFKLELEAQRPVQAAFTAPPPPVHVPNLPSAPAAAPREAGRPAPTPETVALPEVVSPMVGTFYRSPSPDSAPFVQVGQSVTEDTVVCIIEAMKVMNEIKAEVRGTIIEVLVENGTPVQFGQPLFRVQ
jgi:acetyl-CoA carboxylase biotin carboxyl carrier protein